MRIHYYDTPDLNIRNTGLWINGVGHSNHLSKGKLINKEKRVNQDYQILFVMQGEQEVFTARHALRLKKHEGVFIPPHLQFNSYPSQLDNWENYWIHFDGSVAEAIANQMPGSLSDGLIPFQGADLHPQLFDQIISEFVEKAPWFQTVSSSFLHQLLSSIVRNNALAYAGAGRIENVDLAQQPKNDAILSSVHYIHQNFHRPVGVNELARNIGYNRSHFSRQFKLLTGSSPQEYIVRLRISEGKYLLKTTDRSIQSIALSLNYRNSESFTKQFKKVVGVSPQQFRISKSLS